MIDHYDDVSSFVGMKAAGVAGLLAAVAAVAPVELFDADLAALTASIVLLSFLRSALYSSSS